MRDGIQISEANLTHMTDHVDVERINNVLSA